MVCNSMTPEEYFSSCVHIPADLFEWENLTAGYVYHHLTKYIRAKGTQDGTIVLPSCRKMSKEFGISFHTYLKGIHRLDKLGYIKILNEGRPENLFIRINFYEVQRTVTEVTVDDKKGVIYATLHNQYSPNKKLILYKSFVDEVKRMGATDKDIRTACECIETYDKSITSPGKFFLRLFDPKTGRCTGYDKKVGGNKKSKVKLYHADNPNEVPAFISVNSIHTFSELSATMEKLSQGESVLRIDLPFLGVYENCFVAEDDTVTLHPDRVIIHLGDIVPERKGQWIIPVNESKDQIHFWENFILPGERTRKTAREYVIGFKNGREVKNTPGVRTIADFAKQFVGEEVTE